eukprot:11641891-Prorocentrum_lima.AAC.1
MLAELNSMAGEQLVVRFHTDTGSEFWSTEVAELLKSEHILQANTAGNDQKANGIAERFVGLMKRR